MKENETQIKICGFQSIKPAVVAAEEGADYLGFVFVPGNRYYIEPLRARQIAGELRQFNIGIVGIFINEQAETVNRLIDSVRLTHVQLHGNEQPQYCRNIVGARVIKAFGIDDTVNTENLLTTLSKYDADFFVLDRIQRGSGPLVPFTVAKEVARHYPVFLAGGITPENALETIRATAPFGIDIASGVESGGKKDVKKIRELIRIVRGGKND